MAAARGRRAGGDTPGDRQPLRRLRASPLRAAQPAAAVRPPRPARYAADVRGRALDVLERTAFDGTRLTEAGFAFGMIAQHEQQHDETMLITHQLRRGPQALDRTPTGPGAAVHRTGREVLVPAVRSPWARRPTRGPCDNERPAHRREVAPFFIDTRPGDQRRLRGVHRGRRLRRPALVDPRGAGSAHPPAHHHRPAVLAPGRRAVAAAALRRDRGGTGPTSRCSTSAGTRPTRTPAGPGADCPPRPSGRRPARHDPAGDRALRYPWGDADPGHEHANLGQRHLRPAPAAQLPGR